MASLKPEELNEEQQLLAARKLAQNSCHSVKQVADQVTGSIEGLGVDLEKFNKSALIEEVQKAYQVANEQRRNLSRILIRVARHSKPAHIFRKWS